MLIECPPKPFRLLFPNAHFRIGSRRDVFLTFDDGPIPEVTPAVLEILDHFNVKATFFMVGDNAERHHNELEMVIKEGHKIGNHSMHHLQGLFTPTQDYIRDVDKASEIINSTLFRPPHGLLRGAQLRELSRRYDIIMYDVVTRDYNPAISADKILHNVKRFTRPGSIIVFHDSIKSWPSLQVALPQAIKWLLDTGFTPRIVPDFHKK